MESSLRYKTIFSKVPFTKYGQSYRMVEEKDYEFIYLLRTDKQLSRFLSETNEDAEIQKFWIREYKNRERSGNEFYLMCYDPQNDEKLGVIRLCNFSLDIFEVASWLFKLGLNITQAILGDITIKEIGFDLLEYEKCTFEIIKENKSVVKYHQNFLPVLVNEDEHKFYFELSKTNFERNKLKLLKLLGYGPNR